MASSAHLSEVAVPLSSWGEAGHMNKLALPMTDNFSIEALYAPISIGLMGHLGAADTKRPRHACNPSAGNYKTMGVYFQSAVLGTALVYLSLVLLNLYCKPVLAALGFMRSWQTLRVSSCGPRHRGPMTVFSNALHELCLRDV
ncbi:hypothetical protein H310_06270 [Aphanomyces invadans]|uniref:Uncharacterized protein n=1 Tax=Aphanomyces invadans TaxID=157072 RepID=A0A024U5E3_9STRA|nr:hypothetical protein H310_06270 [Aphanomyces invadans]ETW01641.1 hypothetical protein H310_06270 [Aphanomyces invadans]|eukprot:XP_008869489.1 hypothetical protein H310_06270 [Aphanomyces invadans]